MNELTDFLLFSIDDVSELDGFAGVVMVFVVIAQNIAWAVFLFMLPFSLISILTSIKNKLRGDESNEQT